jgi:hypothetical protein
MNGPLRAGTSAASLRPSKARHPHGSSLPGQSAELSASLPRVFEPRIFQGAFRNQHQAVGFERFLDKVVGAAFDDGDSRLVIAVTGDHHDRQLGMLLLEAIKQLKTR